tara:strand:- start:846 stop:1049 length:204 start_codon:yes stop_codon:yes gene_type:complete
MSNKNFKFHFKNDKIDKATSYDFQLNNFTEAMEFAYNKLDQLNEKNNGYRIIGIYEIMMPRSYSKTN